MDISQNGVLLQEGNYLWIRLFSKYGIVKGFILKDPIELLDEQIKKNDRKKR